jgi:hypothetical protein
LRASSVSCFFKENFTFSSIFINFSEENNFLSSFLKIYSFSFSSLTITFCSAMTWYLFYINYTTKNYIIDFFVMQKTTKNASILIWSIFLSIIISLWFIGISTQINKTLKNNQNIQQEINKSNQVKNILNSSNPSSQQLDDWTYLNIPNANLYIWSLKAKQSKNFSFSGTNLDLVEITVKNWWPIKYTYNIWSLNQEYDILRTWSVSFSWNLYNLNTNSNLTIENLWWYTLFQLNSDQSFIAPERYYQIWKKIGNKNILINSSQIK